MTDSVAGKRAGTNPGSLAAVVLAAGEGTRLRPITLRRPKPLCPVGNEALLDHALARVEALGVAVAVNAHHHHEQVAAHLAVRPEIHLSVEAERPLGTAGALARLRDWLDGRDVVAVNGDTWCDEPLARHVDGWDRRSPRVVVAGRGRFGPGSRVVATLVPWSQVARLTEEPASLYETTWRPAAASGRLDVVGSEGSFFDCGTPRRYLAANLFLAEREGGLVLGSGVEMHGEAERSVIGSDCVVGGNVRCSVVWPGTDVVEHEVLDHAIRVNRTMTVLVR